MVPRGAAGPLRYKAPRQRGAATGDRPSAQEAGGQAAEASCDPIRRLLVSGRELEPCSRVVAKVWRQGELFPRVGFIVTNMSAGPEGVVHFYNGRGTAEQWIKEGKYALNWTRLSCHRYRGQSSASVSVHPGLQPGELPAPVMPAQRGQALVAEERPGQADQDGRSAGAPLQVVDLSVVRGVGSSTVVSGSVGSYRPVIADAKLREKRSCQEGERSRESPCLNAGSPHWRGTQRRSDTGVLSTANASLIG